MRKMATPSKENGAFEVAPLRSLDDFILESARFQMPNFRDLDKWGKRVYNNLVYYQSNYFLLALALFALVGLIHPLKMFLGLFAIAVACSLLVAASNGGPQVAKFKQDHPIISVIAILVGAYLIVYLLDGILVFLLGILLPFSATFVHASLRLRSLRNKLTNKMEQIGLKKSTPMGMILDALGFEAEIID